MQFITLNRFNRFKIQPKSKECIFLSTLMQYSTSFANMYLKPGGVYISLSFWIAMHFNLACFWDIELLKELHSCEGY